MQESSNTCFGLEKLNTTLRQFKKNKLEYRKITEQQHYITALVLTTYFRLKKVHVTFFRLEANVASSLHFMVLI